MDDTIVPDTGDNDDTIDPDNVNDDTIAPDNVNDDTTAPDNDTVSVSDTIIFHTLGAKNVIRRELGPIGLARLTPATV